MMDARPFLRLQSDDYLTAMRDKVAEQLLANVQITTLSINGKSGAQSPHIPVISLANQLTEILEERGLGPDGHEPKPRMTLARFA